MALTSNFVIDDFVYAKAPTSAWKSLLEEARPHQWVKNILLFAPLLASHSWHDGAGWLYSFFGFVCFCLMASGVYMLNDALDLAADRQHPRKRWRPLASGRVGIRQVLITLIALWTVGLLGSFTISSRFGIIALGYMALTTLYSFWLKSVLAVDVIALALLYTLRIVAGHAATHIRESFWLFCFSGLMFLSLALLKRLSEIENTAPLQLSGRDYQATDRPVVMTVGVTAGIMAALVLAFYINSPDVTKLYSEPRFLWLTLPLVVIWTLRIWILAARAQVHDDPVVFALKDRFTYATCLGVGIIGWLATATHLA